MGVLKNYYEWLKVADTALPRNIVGYTIQICLSPLRTDPFDLSPYDNVKEILKCGRQGTKGFLLGELPEREGPRPAMVRWMAPHRQATQLSGDDIHKCLDQAIEELVSRHIARVVVRTSVLEKSGEAILIADHVSTPHSVAKSIKREIAHIHKGADFSMHLSLSPADCKEVISKKWGERMTLSGSLVPHEYLIVYTPRTREEVEVVKKIVDAAIMFMTGGQ